MRIATIFLFLFAAFAVGCAPRQYGEINAVVAPGYSASGQSYAIVLAPDMPAKAESDLAMIRDELAAPLAKLGYIVAGPDKTPDVRIEVAYGISGPQRIYTPTSYAWGNSTPGQFFYISPRVGSFNGRRSAYTVEVIFTRTFSLQAFKNVGEELHSPFWGVTVENKGTVAHMRDLLPNMVRASIPWLAQAGQSTAILNDEDTGGK